MNVMPSLLLTAMFGATACQTTNGTSATSQPPGVAPGVARTTPAIASPAIPKGGSGGVAQALAASPDSTVTLTGRYYGSRGPCRGAPPTRSAWQLVDLGDPSQPCIYVDGPFPDGVQSTDGADKAIDVRVEGVLRDESGTRYVEARDVVRP